MNLDVQECGCTFNQGNPLNFEEIALFSNKASWKMRISIVHPVIDWTNPVLDEFIGQLLYGIHIKVGIALPG